MPKFTRRKFVQLMASPLLFLLATSAAAAAPPPPGGADFRISDSDLSHPLRIIAYGDMRFTDPAQVKATNPKVRRWLVDQVAAEKPDAVLLSGDVPWHGGQRRRLR